MRRVGGDVCIMFWGDIALPASALGGLVLLVKQDVGLTVGSYGAAESEISRIKSKLKMKGGVIVLPEVLNCISTTRMKQITMIITKIVE